MQASSGALRDDGSAGADGFGGVGSNGGDADDDDIGDDGCDLDGEVAVQEPLVKERFLMAISSNGSHCSLGAAIFRRPEAGISCTCCFVKT